MYVNKDNLNQIVLEDHPYIDSNGTQYPNNYPRDLIDELVKVIETDQPFDKVIDGFYIDNNFKQVWKTRDKSEQEIINQNKDTLLEQLSNTDISMTRISEDLIQILLNKGILSEGDIPAAVIEKISKRESLRTELNNAEHNT